MAPVVLTGFNTDIDHAGTTYHVQTEDKGRGNPFVESLVYAKGEILYSRRTSYRDLVDQEVDQKAIASLLEKQHRSIVEAIRRGRLADLTRADAEPAAADDGTVISTALPEPPGDTGERSLDQVILDYLAAERSRAHLVLRSAGDSDFVYSRQAEIDLSAVDSHSSDPLPGVLVSVLFKSTADPRRLLLAEGETDVDGRFSATVSLPDYNGGTSAVVISAQSDLGQSEIKHLVHR